MKSKYSRLWDGQPNIFSASKLFCKPKTSILGLAEEIKTLWQLLRKKLKWKFQRESTMAYISVIFWPVPHTAELTTPLSKGWNCPLCPSHSAGWNFILQKDGICYSNWLIFGQKSALREKGLAQEQQIAVNPEPLAQTQTTWTTNQKKRKINATWLSDLYKWNKLLLLREK